MHSMTRTAFALLLGSTALASAIGVQAGSIPAGYYYYSGPHHAPYRHFRHHAYPAYPRHRGYYGHYYRAPERHHDDRYGYRRHADDDSHDHDRRQRRHGNHKRRHTGYAGNHWW